MQTYMFLYFYAGLVYCGNICGWFCGQGRHCRLELQGQGGHHRCSSQWSVLPHRLASRVLWSKSESHPVPVGSDNVGNLLVDRLLWMLSLPSSPKTGAGNCKNINTITTENTTDIIIGEGEQCSGGGSEACWAFKLLVRAGVTP